MKVILFIAALMVSPPSLAQPTDLVPKRLSWAEVKTQISQMEVSGCTLEQGDEIAFFRTQGQNVATSRKTFEAIYEQSGRDLETTLIALDAGQMLCRVVSRP